MRTSKVQMTFIFILICSIIIPFVYDVFRDVLLGNTVGKIEVYISEYMKPVSPTGFIILLLLTINIIIFTYNLWKQKDVLENDNLSLHEEEKYLRKRIERLTDRKIGNHSDTGILSQVNKADKLNIIQQQMKNFVLDRWYLKGIQLYDFSIKLNHIRISRVIEYIDNISSWEQVNYHIDGRLFLEFNKALVNKQEKAFIEKYMNHLNSFRLDQIKEEHSFQFAFINAANQVLRDRNEGLDLHIHYLTELKFFTLIKRIGILEALLYLETNENSGYIFKKKYGDITKKGRYYLAIHYFIDRKPHLMVFIFDKSVSDIYENKKIDDILLQIVEEFLETIASEAKIR